MFLRGNRGLNNFHKVGWTDQVISGKRVRREFAKTKIGGLRGGGGLWLRDWSSIRGQGGGGGGYKTGKEGQVKFHPYRKEYADNSFSQGTTSFGMGFYLLQ